MQRCTFDAVDVSLDFIRVCGQAGFEEMAFGRTVKMHWECELILA